MRQKQLVTKKLDQVVNSLGTLLFKLRSSNLEAKQSENIRESITQIKEQIDDIQTLINNEGNEWI
jgi:uracil phosphoribosyltransferase